MDQRLQALLNDLKIASELSSADLARRVRRSNWLADAPADERALFWNQLAELPMPLAPAADTLLKQAAGELVQRWRTPKSTIAPLEASEIPTLAILYGKLGEFSSARADLLAALTLSDNEASLTQAVELLVSDPPQSDHDLARAVSPLFRKRGIRAELLFPRLLNALSHPTLAAAVLDLANYLTRQKVVEKHPAADRANELIALLGEMTASLSMLEQDPTEHSTTAVDLSRKVAGSVALIVSLCDAVGLIGSEAAIPKLYQVHDLAHRRLKTEAAAAIAKLGDPQGLTQLIKLAEEPVARLRVIAYATELGMLDKVPPQFQSGAARAEAELAVWLAEPTQFGLPPARLELIDERTQFWPGYPEAVACYLFRFHYSVTIGDDERVYSNLGIAGPMTYAFTADLEDLSPDDIYAAFAGFQAEHEDIRQFDVERLSRAEKLEVERLKRRLHDAGYTDIEPVQMGYFFGERSLIASAAVEGVVGVAVVDFQDHSFFSSRGSKRPIGPREAYCIYKGRRLLKTFNRQ